MGVLKDVWIHVADKMRLVSVKQGLARLIRLQSISLTDKRISSCLNLLASVISPFEALYKMDYSRCVHPV